MCDLERENSPQGWCKPEVFIRQAGFSFADTFLVAECGGEVIGYAIGALRAKQRPATGWIIRLGSPGNTGERVLEIASLPQSSAVFWEPGQKEIYLSVHRKQACTSTLRKTWIPGDRVLSGLLR